MRVFLKSRAKRGNPITIHSLKESHLFKIVRDYSVPSLRSGFQNSYILYRPRSSSFRPSSHLRRSSEEIRSAAVLATLEVFSTSSSTKIGQSRRNASASASDGRESMLITLPSRSIQITAKNVSSRSSF